MVIQLISAEVDDVVDRDTQQVACKCDSLNHDHSLVKKSAKFWRIFDRSIESFDGPHHENP